MVVDGASSGLKLSAELNLSMSFSGLSFFLMISECGVQVTVYQCLPEGGAVAVLQTFTDEDVCICTPFGFNQSFYVVCNCTKTILIHKLKHHLMVLKSFLIKVFNVKDHHKIIAQDFGLMVDFCNIGTCLIVASDVNVGLHINYLK